VAAIRIAFAACFCAKADGAKTEMYCNKYVDSQVLVAYFEYLFVVSFHFSLVL